VSEARKGYFNTCYARSTNFSNFTYEVQVLPSREDPHGSSLASRCHCEGRQPHRQRPRV